MDNVNDIIESLKNILENLEGDMESWKVICESPFDERNIETAVGNINEIIEDVSYIDSFFQSHDDLFPDDINDNLLHYLGLLLEELITRKNLLLELTKENDNKRLGRPSIKIDEEQVHGLKLLDFSWIEIVKMLGISPRTLRRKLSKRSAPHILNWEMTNLLSLWQKLFLIILMLEKEL